MSLWSCGRCTHRGRLAVGLSSFLLAGVLASGCTPALAPAEPTTSDEGGALTVSPAAEARGFAPLCVKNYWFGGDTYSGINCVLSTPSGLRWELQFHTIGSLAAKQEGHPLYEIYRLPTTPLKQRRRLFDQLTARWDWVRIPEGILEPYSVHPKEEIKRPSRP